VLVVDDNVDVIETVQIALDSAEYEVISASDGQEGFDVAVDKHPDIILTDVMMPRVSGPEFLQMLLTRTETRDIPVIVMTGVMFGSSPEAVELLFRQEGNVKAFLQKPYQVGQLREAIAQAIKAK
jgi:two-component system alkaline phosphatase synthesis response regulator PhoP